MTPPAEKVDAFVAACRRAASYGLMRCSSGNLSWRIDAEHMLISASRSWMADILPEQVTLCRIADGQCIAGPKPSVETVFHAGTLHRRADMNVVLHFQTPFATTLCCRPPETRNYFVIPEIPYYIGEIAEVPYLPPGSPELADAVVAAMADHDLAMLANHGQVTVGKDVNDAIQKATFFELACEILVRNAGTSRLFTKPELDRIVAG